MLDRGTRYTATSINTAKFISTAAQTLIADSTAKYSLSESHITKANTTSAFLL